MSKPFNPFLQSSDEDLLLLYREKGDLQVVGELFRRYSHLVFAVCMKYFHDKDLSHDAGMQIFEKLIDELKKHEVQHFKAWLHRVCRNHCLMHLRSKQQVVSIDHPQFMEKDLPAHPYNQPDEPLELEAQISALEGCLEELDQDQRLCIDLFYLKKYSYQQIAKEYNYTLMQVKSHLQNGKRNLKILLEKHGHRKA